MKYLFVVAHSDDELLGCGGTIQKLIEEKNEVYICCMTQGSETREFGLPIKMKKTHENLGVKKTYTYTCEALKFDEKNHISLVQFIESVIIDCQCDIVVTHNETDLHPDHRKTYLVTMEAVKLPMRQTKKVNEIKGVYTFEVPCSTGWGIDVFKPNTYVSVNEGQINRKVELNTVYDYVIRDNPHPRSKDNIIALARYRGSHSGQEYAEAYKCVFKLGV